MRKTSFLVCGILILGLFLSCEQAFLRPGSGSIVLTLPGQGSRSAGLPASVVSLEAKVSAPDLPTLRQTLSSTELSASEISIKFTVTPGQNRVVELTGFDSSGIPVYGGKSQVTVLGGQENIVTVTLYPYITVSFDPGSGTGTMAPVRILSSISSALPESTFTNPDFLFAGWATTIGADVSVYPKGSVTLTADQTYYAVWVPVPNPLTPVSAPTNLTLVNYRSFVGQEFYFSVNGMPSSTIYGNGVFSDHSELAPAAVFSGAMIAGANGNVAVRILPGRSSYSAATANTITTQSLGTWPGSFDVRLMTTLVASYGFEDTWNSSIGATHLPTPTGTGVTYGTEFKVGTKSLSYITGASAYATTDNVQTPNTIYFSKNFTISLWVRPNAPAGGYVQKIQTLVSNQTTADGFALGFSLMLHNLNNENRAIRVQVGDGTSVVTAAIPSAGFNYGEWMHLTIVHWNGTMFLYRNGQQVAQQSTAGLTNTSFGSPFRIGAMGSGNFHFDGFIDDLRFYQGVFLPEQIPGLMNP